MHFGLWAPSCVRFIVSLFNWNEDKYASYIEHEMSNMIPVIYIGSLIALTIDSNRNPDLQSYLELSIEEGDKAQVDRQAHVSPARNHTGFSIE